MLIQAFIPELAIETLDKRILGGFPFLNVMKPHSILGRPVSDDMRSKFCAVIDDNLIRQTPLSFDFIKDFRDPFPGDGEGSILNDGFLAAIIDDVKYPEFPATPGKRVAHEIHRPSHPRSGR